jgi:hypothetical protein
LLAGLALLKEGGIVRDDCISHAAQIDNLNRLAVALDLHLDGTPHIPREHFEFVCWLCTQIFGSGGGKKTVVVSLT